MRGMRTAGGARRRPSGSDRWRHDGQLSNAAIQVRLSIKVLLKLPLRQTAGMIASLLRLAGLDWPVPDHATLCRRQKTLQVQIPYRRAGGPLNLLVDSTGIKLLGDGAWQARKHGVQGRRARRRQRGADRWRHLWQHLGAMADKARGARSIWPWTPPPPTSGPGISPPAATATARPCRTFWGRSRTTKTPAP